MEGFVCHITFEVGEKVIDEDIHFVLHSAGDVGSNEAIWGAPERMIGWERFWGGDVEVRGSDLAGLERRDKSFLIDSVATSDVVEGGTRFHCVEFSWVKKFVRGRAGRKQIDHMIGPAKMTFQFGDWKNGNEFIAMNGPSDAFSVASKWFE